MKYVTGLHALNLGDRTVTPGDWHFSALDWRHPFTLEADSSPFASWRIGLQDVPGMGIVPTADHIRACVDLIEQGHYGEAQGMREDYIDDDSFSPEIMRMIWKLRNRDEWPLIDQFMGREYQCQWLDFKQSQNTNTTQAMTQLRVLSPLPHRK
ncbi:hypothetical protein [Bifidobacterium aquikefiricola]|uniref:Uncharacterized protein n=1 Tax=Bifidobacterium aquikefiricola TaxID=3059038 RepID=A0AB39U6D6_9BIFI